MTNTRCFDVKIGHAGWAGTLEQDVRLVVVANSFEEASAAAVEVVNDPSNAAPHEPYTREDVLEMTVVRSGAFVAKGNK